MKKNIFIVLFIITTIVGAALAIYFKIDSDNTKESLQSKINELSHKTEESAQETIVTNDCKDENLTQNVSIEDLFGVDSQSKIIVKVSNNELYYYKGEELITNSLIESEYKKIDSDVKRVKTVNLGTDTTVTFLAIKNDGSVYSLRYDYEAQNVVYEKYMPLSDIEVDDIISVRGFYGEKSGINAEVKKIDGNTEKIVKYF